VLARAVTHALVGLEPRRVEVEADVYENTALASFVIVGLPDRACAEARTRVRSGIYAAELRFPRGRVTVNLAPAELRKEGSGYDLPIALAVLAASRQLPHAELDRHAAVCRWSGATGNRASLRARPRRGAIGPRAGQARR
jgi:magnesium chelatase family protein